MDRFMLDDVEDAYDAVEPLRPSSFDMSFTLSTSGDGSYQDTRNPLHAARNSEDARARRRTGTSAGLTSITDSDVAAAGLPARAATGSHHPYLSDESENEEDQADDSAYARFSAAIKRGRRTTTTSAATLHDQGRLHADERLVDSATNDLSAMKLKSNKRKNVTSIAEKLEEKAQEAMQLSSLVSKMSWKLTKRMQDVHVYRPASISDEDANRVIFRVSCEVKASLHTVMEYLSPRDSKSYFDIESKVFPGLLHASVIKKMEVPPPPPPATAASPAKQQDDSFSETANDKENASPRTQSSTEGGGGDAAKDMAKDLPRLQVKWHASRFAGRFVKPVDFFFVEYSNVETMADGRTRGYGYVRSVESFKGDELATRLNSERVSIPTSVSKCKRAVINKGIYMVTPTGGHGTNHATGTYEVTLMMFIDFQEQFSAAIGQRIVQNFTSRLIGIREQLYRTLFQPVNLLTKNEWKGSKATRCGLCRCTFSLVKPRHHCRSCGEPVCGQCSRKWVVQPGATQKENQTRLCTCCSLQARSFLRPESSAASATFAGSDMAGFTSPERSLASSQMRFTTRLPTPPTPPMSEPAFHREVDLRATVRLPPKTTAQQLLTQPPHQQQLQQQLPHDMFHSDVSVASVITTEADSQSAAKMAFASLVAELSGHAPHLMVVSYSHFHDGLAIYRALAEVAPDTLFMGGTSSGGVFTDAGSVDSGPALGLWGIYDPEGSYTVLNANLQTETPREATKKCLELGMRLLGMEPEESPDFIWMALSAGCEEVVVKTANEVVDCSVSIVAGGSYTNMAASACNATGLFAATQICSEGGEFHVTTHGLCFAVCSPSVEVAHACFTCYEPKDKSFTVTQCVGRELQTLDQKPAFVSLNDGCRGMLHDFVAEPQRFDLEKTKLPLYYPLARVRHESRTARLSKYQVIQPFQALQDSTLVVGCEVRTGEKLRMMSVTGDTVGDRMVLGFREALRASIPVIDVANVVGCVLTVSANYPTILNNETHALALATARTFKSGSVLGAVSTGQQGVLLATTEAMHANAMVSGVLITNRKKAFKLNPLKPVLLRRFSTY